MLKIVLIGLLLLVTIIYLIFKNRQKGVEVLTIQEFLYSGEVTGEKKTLIDNLNDYFKEDFQGDYNEDIDEGDE
ncbi:hypothetical protein [Fredinandcohnia quinoae]|uniref:Uncharacterized protein n=1 Tax=Fredinandcohnia quinoae TaxID=2918902 RepID=A0AAW5E8W1_9BACI|nr:hypothetical protein [Fredinandcohnia sp. SECRCQ15]MCH1626466.1 hypothetical protein [Fredinandcohnia sp. SECRCQ15]